MPSSFNYDYDPEKEIKATLSKIKISAPGKKVLLIGHSWGGHAVQNFLQKNKQGQIGDWTIMGGVLLASSIQRGLVTIQKDGSSLIDIGPTPIMVIGAELDGLNRVSRFAESFYHTDINLNNQQKGKFITLLMKGMNHAQFANEKAQQPVYIRNDDLKAETPQDQNLDTIADVVKIRFFEENPEMMKKL